MHMLCVQHLNVYCICASMKWKNKQVSSIQFLNDNWSTRIILAFYLCIFSIVIPLRVGKIQIWKTKQVSLFYRPVFFYSNQTLKNVALFLTIWRRFWLWIWTNIFTFTYEITERTIKNRNIHFWQVQTSNVWHQCRKKTLDFLRRLPN